MNVAYLNEARTAPMSAEAEQAALGLVLMNPECIGRIVSRGGADLFYDPAHARIFDVAAEKNKLGHFVSPVSMAEAVGRDPVLSEIGGPSYLARLGGSAPSVASLNGYIDLLADLRRKREIVVAISDAKASIARGDETADIIAGKLEAAMLASTPAGSTGPVSMARAVTTAMSQIVSAYHGEEENHVKSGIEALDKLIGGFYPGELILIGGRPSMGKSGLALSIALNAAREGHGVCIASLEMNPEAMAMRALSEATAQARHAVAYSKMRRGELAESQMQSLVNSAPLVADLPITFLPRQFADISALFAGAKQVHRATPGGLKLFIVDYAQLLRSDARGRYEQITEISIALKALSGQLNVPVIALSQLNRSVETRDDKRPMLSDLKESGQLEQDADAVLFCYRDEYYEERNQPAMTAKPEEHMDWRAAMEACRNRLEIIVAKQRQGEIGTARVMFNPALNLVWNANG